VNNYQNRRLSVRHTTTSTYHQPISHSSHRLHLRPLTDRRQAVLDHQLEISLPVQLLHFEDVFGNEVTRFDINEPYAELTITSRATVELIAEDPFAFASIPIRPAYPLVWMPWQRLMLNPYLQPVELPETQLQEIVAYGMSIVEQNNRDLMETLFAINLHLHNDYQYCPGATNVFTTPYDFFVNKRGVCQDFANLFVCIARMLGIPARYVCGYMHTGNNGQNRVGGDATHAWVELYIPNVGWKGFDPTNGTLAHLDHIRVAYGRHYIDTAPTSGTLYTPAIETLSVDVEVCDVAV
jgi:transglutaminase-like putative cysteine protease